MTMDTAVMYLAEELEDYLGISKEEALRIAEYTCSVGDDKSTREFLCNVMKARGDYVADRFLDIKHDDEI